MNMVPPPGPREPGTHDNSIAPSAADRDEPYTWGRSRNALKSSVDDLVFARLLVLRGRIQDRRIAQHISEPDPDGL